MLERVLRDIAAGGYRSRSLEKAGLEDLRDIAAGNYRSRVLEEVVLKKTAEYRNKKLLE